MHIIISACIDCCTIMNLLASTGILVAVLHLAASQLLPAVGTCTQQEVTTFVTRLPNGEECKSALETILGPDKTPSQLQPALSTFCTHTCGEAYTRFTSENCGDIQYTFRLIVYCLPVPTFPEEQNRCRYAFPDVLGNDLINSLRNCTDFNPMSPSCNSECQIAIQALTNGTQCCYQNLYNSTMVDPEVLRGLISNGFLTEAQGDLIISVTHPALWEACEVPLTTFCFGEYFVGPTSLVSGICTQDRIDSFIGSLSTSCQESYSITSGATASTREAEDAVDVICTSDCGGMVAQFQREVCLDNFDSFLSMVTCHETDGALGGHCIFTLGQHLRNASFFFNAQRYCTDVFDPDTAECPPMCGDALREVTRQLGCCYQTIYNNTEARDLLLVNEDIEFFEWFFFRLLGNANIWNACQVPLIEACHGNPLSGGVVLNPPTIVMFCAAIFSAMRL